MAARKQPSMTRSVNAAIKAMHWLTDADKAAVSLAMAYAKQIDDAAADSPEEARKVAGWMGPHLTGLLKQLGGTPEGRKSLALETQQVKGRLAELRALRDRDSA